MYILEKVGLSIEVLESLSYKSGLSVSMKRTLRHFDSERCWLIFEMLVSGTTCRPIYIIFQ